MKKLACAITLAVFSAGVLADGPVRNDATGNQVYTSPNLPGASRPYEEGNDPDAGASSADTGTGEDNPDLYSLGKDSSSPDQLTHPLLGKSASRWGDGMFKSLDRGAGN